MLQNSEQIADSLNFFSVCFLSCSVLDCLSHLDIEVEECLYWLVIRSLLQLSCYLTVYQLIMNNQRNKSQIYYDLAFMKIMYHHVCMSDQYQITLFNMFERFVIILCFLLIWLFFQLLWWRLRSLIKMYLSD